MRAGWLADLIVVNGNPLENLKVFNPLNRGIEWTIKDGYVYHTPRLFADVKEMVKKARKQ